MAEASDASARYLNVDLEIRSPSDLAPLAKAVSRQLIVLYAGKVGREYLLSLEVNGLSSNPDAVIRRFDRVIGSLSPAARRLWLRARDRVFDVGVEAAGGKVPLVVTLAPDTVKTVARLKARIALTVYRRLPRRRRRNLIRQ
jgi:hypothetical protein